jgi:surface protein
LNILSSLDASNVVALERVNKRWQQLCKETIQANFQPKKDLESNSELRDAVAMYCRYKRKKEEIDEIGRTYGFPIGKWRVGKLTDFSEVFFFGYINFNEDIGDWDVSEAKCLHRMFCSASSFNQPLDKWDTRQVTDMSYMFFGAVSFNQPLNDWDTSNVRNLSNAFHNAVSFNQNLSNWNTCQVTDMSGMLSGAKSFNQPLNSWVMCDVQSVCSMFHNASSFNQPLHAWNTSKVKSMSVMFMNAVSFNQPLNGWDVSSIENERGYAAILMGANAFQQALPRCWDRIIAFHER